MLTDSNDWRSTSSAINTPDGSFIVEISDKTTIPALGDTLLAIINATSAKYVKKIEAKLLVSEKGWTNVLLAGYNVDLSSGKGSVKGNLHANNKVNVGTKYSIDGNITEAPPTVNMPVIDWDFFKNEAIAVGQYSTSDINLKIDDSPYTGVWYTTKKIKIEDNNVIINGTLVAEEDMEIKKNNVEIYATPTSYPAIIVGNDLKIDFNNTIIEGLVYSDHDIILEKNNGTINGALVAKNNIINKSNGLILNLDPTYTSGLTGVEVDSTVILKGGVDVISWIEK